MGHTRLDHTLLDLPGRGRSDRVPASVRHDGTEDGPDRPLDALLTSTGSR